MPAAKYTLRLWGGRGTVPSPGAHTVRFGGNTSCASLSLSAREHIVIDCGSGLRFFGRAGAAQGTDAGARYHLFLSHYHFDHVEGLPLFPPLYQKQSRITVYGPESCGQEPREILENLVRPPYFPVTLADVPCDIDYETIRGAPVSVGDVTIESMSLNHPDGCLSFRLDREGRRIVYASDHEHGHDETDRALIEFARGAEFLIYDATYQPAEYEELRRGWGHSTWYAAVRTAIAAKVKTLVLFHHHPDYTDDELARVLRVAQADFPSTVISHEGLELPL